MAATVTVVDTTTPIRSIPELSQSLQLISDPPADLPLIQSTQSNPVVDALCRLLLAIIHLAYLTFITLKVLRNHAVDFYRNVVTTTPINDLIRFDKAQLTKIPKHFSILISNELAHERSEQGWDTIVDEICRVSCWAYEFGIEELSVFDASGNV